MHLDRSRWTHHFALFTTAIVFLASCAPSPAAPASKSEPAAAPAAPASKPAAKPAEAAPKSAGQVPAAVLAYPQLVLHNAKVLTLDRDDDRSTVAQAVAIRDDIILAVGSNQDILALAGPNTRQVDAAGRSVIPGIIDTHTHLHEYAMENFAPQVAPHLTPHALQGTTPDELIAKAGALLQGIPAGTWVLATVRPRSVADQLVSTKTRFDLDQVSPNHPLLMRVTDTKNLVNSLAIEALLKKYPENQLELKRDAGGRITGETGSGVTLIFDEELMPKQPPEVLAPIYKRELDAYAAAGVTTWSSSIASEALTTLNWMDQQGMLPNRFALTHESSIRDNPAGVSFVDRLGLLTGNGSPYVWWIGLSSGSTDSSYPGVCTTIDARPQIKAREDCRLLPGNTRWRAGYQSVKLGHRVTGTHSAGDMETDMLMDMIEKASLEIGMSYEQIRAKRHAIDHCTFNPRPDQIERGLRLGIYWSCGPKYFDRVSRIAQDYDPEFANEWVLPVGGIFKAGGKSVFESDNHEQGLEPFKLLEALVTRKDPEGKVWGPQHAVDRMTALRMATSWAAEYVLREKVLGTVQPGKWADLVMLNGDYQAVPDGEIHNLKAAITIVNGKIVFEGS
jgi:hypothetical protein